MSKNLNDLLAATRAEFLRLFLDAMQKTLPHCIDDLFKKADSSYSSSEQGRLLNSRSTLMDQGGMLLRQMSKNMEALLTRSFQTTYNTFRPSISSALSADSMSLLDSSAFEDELRIDEITKRFRSEAEEQLRDLNIRIAIIFEQDVTKERENPFRPYLFSRCIATSVGDLGLTQDLSGTIMEQLAEQFTQYVSGIYDAVNQHLAKHGIAAQLQRKIKKSPTQAPTPAAPHETGAAPSDDHFGDQTFGHSQTFGQSQQHAAHNPNQPMRQTGFGQQAQAMSSHDNAYRPGEHSRYGVDPTEAEIRSREISSDRPRRQVEQLFDAVRGMASGFAGRVADAAQNRHLGGSSQDGGGTERQGSQKQFGWMPTGQAVGGVLRKFFGQGESGPQSNGAADFGNSTLGGLQRNSVMSKGAGRNSGQLGGFSNSSLLRTNTVDPNMRGLSNTHGGNTVGGGGGVGSASILQSVQGMQMANTPQSEDMWDSQGAVRNLILEQRAALNEMTENVDEQMTIDIVAMLFEFILRDNQVPAEVRAQLGRLQFLVLKIALRDSSLLTQKGHPARMLVNRIGSISLGLKQIDPSGAHITTEICRIVETLLKDDSENPQLFAKMLDEFDAFIAHELRASDKNVERTVEAMEQVQNRTLRFAHTSARMAEALQGLTIDRYLHEFLENIWVHAIELADREEPKRAQRYRLFVPDILWSIVPKYREDDRSQLFALLPIILGTLREGLKTIDYNPQLQQNLMNWLVDAHTSALRASHAATMPVVPSLSAIHEHFKNFVHNPEEAPKTEIVSDSIADAHRLLDQAIKELDLKVQVLDQVFDVELPPESQEQKNAPVVGELNPEAIQERLKSGVGLEINLGGKPSMGKLNWVDPNLKNLVLTLEGQESPSIVSVRMFRRMIAHGRVKFLEAEPLFERAVQSLLKSADTIDQTVSA